ncbi:MAG: ArsB/NhaD family transporter [Chloroflexota bacterium]
MEYLTKQLEQAVNWTRRNREQVQWGGVGIILVLFIIALPSLLSGGETHPATEAPVDSEVLTFMGQVIDKQGEPLAETEIRVCTTHDEDTVTIHSETQADGWYRLALPVSSDISAQILSGEESLCLELERPNFVPVQLLFSIEDWVTQDESFHILLPTTTLDHRIGAAFWFVTVVFIITMFLIATERVHKTIAALAGAALILSVSQVVGLFDPAWRIIDFEGAMHAIDFEVIFLLVGMMIFVGLVEGTGLFQWVAFTAYRLAGGKPWRLTVILVLVTAVLSALLDNVTTILLMAPITIEIALKIGVNPLYILLPEVLASNFGGAATLVGSPPSILIGTQADLSFGDFLVNTGPVAIVALVLLLLYLRWRYSVHYEEAEEIDSDALLKRLEEDARITEPQVLKRGILVGASMVALFLVGPQLEMEPALIALAGAAALLIWVRPDVEKAVQHVDWTTLLFFMSLFIQVGALEEVGLIAKLAEAIGDLAGNSMVLAILLTLWPAMIMSAIIDNVPFAAAMIPVAHYLTANVPGAGGGVIYWALVLGASFGGNATLVGASANLVAAGIAERAGFRITYRKFMEFGAPIAIVATILAMGWLLLRY